MTPARKTTSILVLAAGVACAALLLTKARASERRIVQATPATKDGVQVSAHLESSHVLAGHSTTHMAITVQAPEIDGVRRRPALNLAIVLDRSGSMHGEKLENAKAAARELISHLEDGDRFSITVYGSEVDTIFPSAYATANAKNAAVNTINGIYDDGGTNLSGGMLAGRSQALSQNIEGAVSRIVLISDGQANEGIVDELELGKLAQSTAEMGVSVTTLGVGLDFDEKVMTRIAVSGHGNYYFAESAYQLTELFNKEFERVGATAATDVSVALTPAAGVTIEEAYGYTLRNEGGHSILSISDLHSGETRKVVLRLSVNAASTGSMDLAEIKTTFRPVGKTDFDSVSMTARAEVTRNQKTVLDNRNKDAVRFIESARTAQAINEATVLYERGRAEEAQQLMSVRKAEAAGIAADVGDAEFAAQIAGTADEVSKNFDKKAAPSSMKGKRNRKASRKDAYDLMY